VVCVMILIYLNAGILDFTMFFVLMMMMLAFVVWLPLFFLLLHIDWLAVAPHRAGFVPGGAVFEYRWESQMHMPLKSVKWATVERTNFHSPLGISTLKLSVGGKVSELYVDSAIQERVQREFECVKGVDKQRDVNSKFVD